LVDDLVGKVVSREDLFDTELVLRAERKGYRIVEVPVNVEETRPVRSILKRVPRTLRGLLRIRRILGASTWPPSQPHHRELLRRRTTRRRPTTDTGTRAQLP